MKRVNMKTAEELCELLWPFRAYGTLSGVRGAVEDLGQMPAEWQVIYREGAEFGSIVYTVLSAGTPIVWLLQSGPVVMPDVQYASPTKNRHQLRMRDWFRFFSRILTRVGEFNPPAAQRSSRPSTMDGEGAIYSPEYLAARAARKTPAAMS